MAQKGYVFSLDAFVAFSLMLIAIQALLVMSTSPKAYSGALLQAQYIAHDTVQVMGIAKLYCPTGAGCDNRTYLEAIAPYAVGRGNCLGVPFCSETFRNLSDQFVPPQYSYAFIYDDLEGGSWTVYNASNDPLSTHYNVTFRRVMASASTYLLGYSQPLRPGDSPYCNVVCKGYNATSGSSSSPAACTQVPCDAPVNGFDNGNFSVGLIRMSVWG